MIEREILQIIWVAAHLGLRAQWRRDCPPGAHAANSPRMWCPACARRGELWGMVGDISRELGYPPAPITYVRRTR